MWGSWQDDWTGHLVECVVNVGELGWSELAGVDALDLATKVDKVGWICGGRQRQGGQFDDHR